MEKNEYIDRVNNLLGDYLKYENQIAALEEQRKQVKDILSNLFESAADYLDPDTRIQVAYFWYWQSSLDVASIGAFLGIHANSVSSTVGPFSAGYFCKCGAEEMYTSRTDRQATDSARKDREFECDNCREKERAERSSEWQRQQEKQAREIQRYKEMPYKAYLQTDHWHGVRKAALRRAYYRCQLCSSKSNLQVHHNTYDNRGDEQPRDVIVLCNDCHEKHHDVGQKYRVPDEYSDIIIG